MKAKKHFPWGKCFLMLWGPMGRHDPGDKFESREE